MHPTLTQFHTLPPLEIPPWKRCIPADLMKPSLPGMGNGCLGKKSSGGWEYRAHGLEVLTQKEPPMRDEK
ncbi:hypothetical protein EAI89_18465 [Eubacterium sp. am_0171]|nr:hypothetical protein EAI89_18465 [Eubacterium sp. am_0171]